MYSFPHPQAIFDGGGNLVTIYKVMDVGAGGTLTMIDYTVPQNRVFHLIHVYGQCFPAGTTGILSVTIDLRDPSDQTLARILNVSGAYNSAMRDLIINMPVSILIPRNYKIVAIAWNRINAQTTFVTSIIGIEYEVFRS
jgi:hypothetical protein